MTKPISPRNAILLVVGIIAALALGSIAVAQLMKSDPLADAVTACTPVRTGFNLADNDQTLIVRTSDKANTGAAIEAVACVFGRLEMPTSVIDHIDTTRALDGRQSDEWSGYSASWTYHPDDGLRLTILRR